MIKLWIARDMNGDLYAYEEKPVMVHEQWIINPSAQKGSSECNFIRENIFKDVKWDDDEHTEISLYDLIAECKKYYNDLAKKFLVL